MPSVLSFMTTLSIKFDLMKNNLKLELKDQTFVCLTTDIWSHRAKSYLGVSVHYINAHWQRKSYILAFRRLYERHSYEYLAKWLHDIIEEFGLSIGKITHVVTDGGSNFCKAFRIFGSDNDFNVTLAALEQVEDDENNEAEDVILVGGNSVAVVGGDANECSENENNHNVEVFEDVFTDIERASIQGDQIDFSQDLDSNDIVLPSQMRCFSHLLNLIGKFLVQSLYYITLYFYIIFIIVLFHRKS